MASIEDIFFETYGARPTCIWSAPGRVNLIGEHTDYNGGASLPFAINHRLRVAVRARKDQKLCAYSTFDQSTFTSKLECTTPLTGWGKFVFGITQTINKVRNIPSGFDMVIESDLPSGIGVSSSHALQCAVGMSVIDLYSLKIHRKEMIRLTQHVENEIVGAPTGTMDQSAILLGKRDHGVFLDFGNDTVEEVQLGFKDAGLCVLLIDSQERHDHSTGDYGKRRRECENATTLLGVSMLSELNSKDLELLHNRIPDIEFRRARHVITDTERTRKVASLLLQGRPKEIGSLLMESHESERKDFEISTPAIDAAVKASIKAGAMGARLTGGGFGGACIALVNEDDAQKISAVIQSEVKKSGFPEPVILKVSADDGAYREK